MPAWTLSLVEGDVSGKRSRKGWRLPRVPLSNRFASATARPDSWRFASTATQTAIFLRVPGRDLGPPVPDPRVKFGQFMVMLKLRWAMSGHVEAICQILFGHISFASQNVPWAGPGFWLSFCELCWLQMGEKCSHLGARLVILWILMATKARASLARCTDKRRGRILCYLWIHVNTASDASCRVAPFLKTLASFFGNTTKSLSLSDREICIILYPRFLRRDIYSILR